MALKLKKERSKPSSVSNDSQILKNLNQPQLDAVTTIDGPLLVIAGAGSGKTRVLTHRTAYLLEKGVPPWNVLALTFTNKAAKEMRDRIANIVSPEKAGGIWAGTFHSIFARILRSEADKLGYTGSFSIYDTDDSLRLVRQIMASIGISQQEYPAQGMRSRISWAKNQMISWQSYADSAGSALEKQTTIIFQEYEKQLRNNNAMDFDDLLLNMIAVLKQSKETLAKYQERFKFILVDEYQDTNRAQYVAVNMLAQSHKNLCVVGDDAQSIYKWRGADIKNILDFQKDYPDAKVIRLEQNYRSTKVILEAAGSVIKQNRRQIPKKLWTENIEGEKIEIISCTDDKSEAAKITKAIEKKLINDFSAKDIAILYRTNAQSLSLENALRHSGIPYVIVGGISFYKRKEIKDAIAYLRLLLNPQDDEALVRIINEPPRGLGQVSLGHFRNFAAEKGISLFEAFKNGGDIEGLMKRARNSAAKFVELVDKYISLKEEMQPSELIMNYIEESGLLQMYKDINTEDALDRWNNIQQLLSDISMFFRKEKDATFEDYLQQISLVSDIDEKDISQDKVTLMTLHSAKGLEFPIVFIAGMEQGLFPLAKADQNPEEEEEERRLFYVGITRAREKLFLTYSQRRMRFGEITSQAPSKFINEISAKCVSFSGSLREKAETKPKRTYQQDPMFPTNRAKSNDHSQIPEANFDFKVGDKVRHSKFGVGKITGLSGTGAKRQAVVYFPPVGKKKLMLQYAKLEKA